jgi:hypothetical protein
MVPFKQAVLIQATVPTGNQAFVTELMKPHYLEAIQSYVDHSGRAV